MKINKLLQLSRYRNNQLERPALELLMLANDLPILLAVRKGLAQVLPLVIAGAAALLLLHLPIPEIHGFLDDIAGKKWRTICQLIQQSSFGITSLAALVSISYAYARQQSHSQNIRLNPVVAVATCLSSYFVMAKPLGGPIEPACFSFSGGFPMALSIAVTCTPLFLFLSKYNPFRKYLFTLSSDPEVNDAITAIPVSFLIIFMFAGLRIFFENIGLANLPLQAQSLFGAPFQGRSAGLATGVEYIGLSQFLWFFGIHGPNLLVTVENNILLSAFQLNAHAVSMGGEAMNILTKPFIDAFVHIGGSGSTLALIFAIFLRSKEKYNHRLSFLALVPALFNVNEVLVFGLPLVLNPVYLIPFVLAPLIQLAIAYGLTVMDLVPVVVHDIHWTSPILLGGYMATGSIAGAILQVVCLGVGVLVYLPFVGLGNSVYALRVKKDMAILSKMADSPLTGPGGKKCIYLPGRTGQFAKGLAADLELALKRADQIFLVYQPLVDLNKKETMGAETLLRWRHPIHGLVPPHVTVALAEDTGLISKLGMQVLYKACRFQFEAFGQSDVQPVLSVNVSAPQLEDKDLVEKIASILEKTGVDPHILKLEVTESIALAPDAKSIGLLSRLRKMGIRIAIDDFGMGHTSLRYLKEFPVDTIKIDRSLTQESNSKVNDQIIKSIVNLCEALGTEIIVEGVETPDQVVRFKQYRCSIFQGYFFSRPLSEQDYVGYCHEAGRKDIQQKLNKVSGKKNV